MFLQPFAVTNKLRQKTPPLIAFEKIKPQNKKRSYFVGARAARPQLLASEVKKFIETRLLGQRICLPGGKQAGEPPALRQRMIPFFEYGVYFFKNY